jgi:general stress protein YciG
VRREKKLTISEFARMGGKARAAKLTAARRNEIASAAGKKGGRESDRSRSSPNRHLLNRFSIGPDESRHLTYGGR